jgi:hypothetical protein
MNNTIKEIVSPDRFPSIISEVMKSEMITASRFSESIKGMSVLDYAEKVALLAEILKSNSDNVQTDSYFVKLAIVNISAS